VNFTAVLQSGGRFQIPRLIRWRYKMESDQILVVHLSVADMFSSNETFYARMTKDGRIDIPKLHLARLASSKDEPSLRGYALTVQILPA
jgi:hypothetical protein